MFPFIGGARVELIEPKQNVESRFRQFLEEHGEGVMAISFFTDDLKAQVKDLQDNGFTVEEEVQADLFPDHAFKQ
jgi:4-hydroxyphenylpyruvate dioxygenase-like putative hemolysin